MVLTGFVGQISFATYAFAGFAAFALVKVSDAGLPFPLGPLVAGEERDLGTIFLPPLQR